MSPVNPVWKDTYYPTKTTQPADVTPSPTATKKESAPADYSLNGLRAAIIIGTLIAVMLIFYFGLSAKQSSG